jgi:hypothetical protein
VSYVGSIIRALFSASWLALIVTVLGVVTFWVITLGCNAAGYSQELASVEDQVVKAIGSYQPASLVWLYEQALEEPPQPYTSIVIVEVVGKKHFDSAPVSLGYWAYGVRAFPPLEGVVAFADTVWHLLAANSWIGRAYIVFQLVIGAFLSALVIILLDPKDRLHDLAVITLLCVGSIALGSFSAFLVQRLMDIGQQLTFIQFGALCFGSGGTGGGFSISIRVAEAWSERGSEAA